MLIDSHCHITDERYSSPDEIVSRMSIDGPDELVTVGYDMPSSEKVALLAARFDNVYAAVGIHPDDAGSVNESTLARLNRLAQGDKVVMIGEIGLDYHYEGYDKTEQIRAMLMQMELAKSIGKPMSFHIRDAFGDMTEVFSSHKNLLSNSGVMHCFSGSREVAEFCLSLGLYISFSGTVTFNNSKRLKEVAAIVPADRLLIETDSPYLAPQPVRGKTNYPSYVKYVADSLAEIRGTTSEEIQRITYDNAHSLFNKGRRK